MFLEIRLLKIFLFFILYTKNLEKKTEREYFKIFYAIILEKNYFTPFSGKNVI